MAKHHAQPGLDNRHRDNDGTIHRKRSDTNMGTLQDQYPGFADGVNPRMHLGTYLERTGFDSLAQALRKDR